MEKDFFQLLNVLYEKLICSINIIDKLAVINECKSLLGIKETENFGQWYYELIKNNKENGVIYTPEELSKFIVEKTITDKVIVDNPYIKILDPSCGTGNILIQSYHHLRKLYIKNLDVVNKKNKLNLKSEDIDAHIVRNNLFGFDIDPYALKILQIDLFNLSKSMSKDNFINKDFLFYHSNEQYNIILGNPPYIGHKVLGEEYKKILKESFKEVYNDKGDISFCFYKKALDTLEKKGKVSFITSRYFLESISGKGLREYISKSSNIESIVDYYGVRPFKGVGIDPVIMFLNKDKKKEEVNVLKPISYGYLRKKGELKEVIGEHIFRSFFVNSGDLNSTNWILRDKEEKDIIKKIEKKSLLSLGDICNSYQGIITGCDKAFIVDEETIEKNNLEKEIIEKWIKSSHIDKSNIKESSTYILYSNRIRDEGDYPNIINYIKKHKEKLSNRRECRKGIRQWYELQWGRESSIFNSKKIVHPYKASCNKFALSKNHYFSADVYALKIKDEEVISYQCLTNILNSKLYDFYFKAIGKKLGRDLYEYYPNTLLNLKIPIIDMISEEDILGYFDITEREKIIINSYY